MSGLNTLGFIQTNSLTYTEIQNDLQNFINALSEDEKLGFKTLFEGTNSKILIELLSAKSSDEIYHIITSRSENLMYYCNRLDSAISISQNYAYSANRGNNLKFRLEIIPDETATISKMSEIGIADDYSLITVEDIELVKGEKQLIDVYVGHLKEQELIADSENLLIFRFTNQNISEQFALYLNNIEVPHTKNIIEILNDKYFCITNSYSGIDAIYLNNNPEFTHRYTYNDILKIKYIEYEDISIDSIDIQFNYGTITKVVQLHPTQEPEDVDSIRTKSKAFAETQNRIVARDDFKRIFLYSNPEIVNTSGHDYDNPHVEITYVKKDGTFLTQDEYNEAYNYLYNRRAFGIPMCLISNPDIMLNLNIKIILQLKSGTSSAAESYIDKVLSNYELKLGETFNFSDIEHGIEGYEFIKTARIVPNYKSYLPNTLSPEGVIYEPTVENGKLYIVRNPLFLSGNSEPVWDTTIGNITIDNDIQWMCEKLSATPQAKWQPDTSYVLQNVVTPTESPTVQYRCVGFTYKTGDNEPDWDINIGSYTIDNQILWLTIKKDDTANAWSSSTITSKGAVVNSTSSLDVSFQAINYVPITPEEEPNWSTTSGIFTDKNIQYIVIDKYYDELNPKNSNIKLNWNQYVIFNKSLEIV